MDKINTITLPKLNKGELVIVSTEAFNQLVDSINNVLEQANDIILNLKQSNTSLQDTLTTLKLDYAALKKSNELSIATLRTEIVTLKNNMSLLATSIKEGGFLNE